MKHEIVFIQNNVLTIKYVTADNVAHAIAVAGVAIEAITCIRNTLVTPQTLAEAHA